MQSPGNDEDVWNWKGNEVQVIPLGVTGARIYEGSTCQTKDSLLFTKTKTLGEYIFQDTTLFSENWGSYYFAPDFMIIRATWMYFCFIDRVSSLAPFWFYIALLTYWILPLICVAKVAPFNFFRCMLADIFLPPGKPQVGSLVNLQPSTWSTHYF